MFINFPFLIRKKKKIQKEKENLKNSKKKRRKNFTTIQSYRKGN